jgi:hypothetical protein
MTKKQPRLKKLRRRQRAILMDATLLTIAAFYFLWLIVT